ncbi:transposase [bacterium]|nr:transposase [bacterium]
MNANTSRHHAKKHRRRWTDEQKRWILQDQKQSGLSLWEYAQQQSIGYSSMAAWKRKLSSNSDKVDHRNGDASVVFHELPDSPEPMPQSDAAPALRVRFASGTVLEVGAGCDPSLAEIILTHLR